MNRNSKKMALFIVIALAAMILPIIATAAQTARNPNPPTSPVTGNAANGKGLYYNYSCYGCHGFNGETGRAFVGNWSSNLANEENFIRFLRARANVAPATPSTSQPGLFRREPYCCTTCTIS